MDVIGFVEACTVIFRQLPPFQGDWLWSYLWCNIVFSFLKLSPQITQVNGFRSQRFAISSHLKENIKTIVTSFNKWESEYYWFYLTKDTLWHKAEVGGGSLSTLSILILAHPVHDLVTNK